MWNINSNFREELRKPVHQTTVKAVVLDTDFVAVEAGEFYDERTDELQNFITDGNVDVATDRGTRRTVELTLRNSSEQFTPNTDWTGNFYINRVIRLFRGVVVGQDRLYAPIGTFMIDHAEVIVERNISVVVLSASDLWKKFTKSIFVKPKTYVAGTHLNAVITDFATAAGANFPLAPSLDPLTSVDRQAENTVLQADFSYERGDNRGEKLKELCEAFGVDIFFDVNGRLTTNDRQDSKDKASVWRFADTADGSGMLISTRRSFNDDYLYNHVIAIATGDEKNILIHEISDTDPNSFTNVDRIGDRVSFFESDLWQTFEHVESAAKMAWLRRFGIAEELVIETICQPALDGDDVITVKENWSGSDGTYRIRSMNIPLSTSLQTIKCVNFIKS